jgi:hypothetical protein
MKRPARVTSRLPVSLHHRLNAYALAASAAGVGVLALTPAAEARIVYTKTHKSIGVNTIFRLDLNHDGITDFERRTTVRRLSAHRRGLFTLMRIGRRMRYWETYLPPQMAITFSTPPPYSPMCRSDLRRNSLSVR